MLVLAGMVAICGLGLWIVSSGRSPVLGPTLVLATGGGVVAGLGLFVVMPFERGGSALAGRAPAGLGWMLAGVLVAGVPIAVLLLAEQVADRQSAHALWHLCSVAPLTTFAAAVIAIRSAPGAVPDLVPRAAAWQGDGVTGMLVHQNSVEALDPYVLPLLVATLLLGGRVLTTFVVRPRPSASGTACHS